MIRPRLIPALLLNESGLLKTTQFKNPIYLGDPLNIINIFNKKMVDELVLMDITCSQKHINIKFDLLKRIASVCFSPITYGGGVKSIEDADRIFNLGIEKVCLNTHAHKDPTIIYDIAKRYGSQSVVICLNVRRNIFGKIEILDNSLKKIPIDISLFEYMRKLQDLGAGEIIVYDVMRDGTFKGYDIKLFMDLASSVTIPLIAAGGARDLDDIKNLLNGKGVSGAAVGSLFVYYGPRKAVLISYPERKIIKNLIR